MDQNITDKEQDILHTIEILNQLGFFTTCDTRKSRDCDIVLETFPGLQSDRAFHLTQVGLTPNKGPVSKRKYILSKLVYFNSISYRINIFKFLKRNSTTI